MPTRPAARINDKSREALPPAALYPGLMPGVIRRPLRGRQGHLIFASLNSTCLRTTGSYFLKLSFSVLVRGFFFVT